MTRTKKITSAIIAAVAVLVCALFVVIPQTTAHAADVWDGLPATAFEGGDGSSADNAYQISNGAQLAYLAE